jgi:hypothetical protein
MKICVLNFSGNVGKSTICAHLLQPRMKAQVFSVESLNLDAAGEGLDVVRVRGQQFASLMQQVMKLDDAIVDVGSSNVEAFLKLMQHHAGSQEEFDCYIVPVVKDAKQQGDTTNTVLALQALDIPPDKIRIVINKVDTDDDLQTDFASVYSFCATGMALLPDRAVVYANDVFEGLKAMRMTIGDLDADTTDYRQRLREATTEAQKDQAINMILMKRLAKTCNKNLDAAYAALFARERAAVPA